MPIPTQCSRISAMLASCTMLAASDASVPGALSLPNPTTCGISIEWPFSGDDDGDARVAMRYRPAGGAWKTGMPLFRVPAGSTQGVSWGSRHVGSVFDLQPGTTYEIEVTLADPDGGSAVRTATTTTRAVPEAMAGARVVTATPATLAARVAALVPGDVLDLPAGTYPGFTLGTAGEAARPIVVRSTAGAVVDGMVELNSAQHVLLQGLTVNGRIRMNSTRGIAITGCTINARADRGDGFAIVSFLRSEDAYIADNTVVGTTVWAEASLGVSGHNLGEGICLTGPGHVIRNNRIRGFRDGLSLMEYSEAVDQYAIDIVENDVSECADDGIEADFAAGNVRVLRNRLTNCFMGISSQPGLGGPLYLVRNAMYNVVFEAFKLHNGTYGDVLVNNTVVKSGDAFSVFSGATIARTWSRNNLFIGGPGGTYGGYATGTGRVMNLADLAVATVSLDYDGFGSTAGTFSARFGPSLAPASLAELRSQTTEVHATQLGLTAFATTVAYPGSPMTVYAAPDLRLAPAGAAVDAGTAVPGITDGFAGAAPDLGAYEVGAAIPSYGPRSPEIPDTTPPVISAVDISEVSATTATVAWLTDEGADGQVEFGPDDAYGGVSAVATGLSTAHRIHITGLAPETVVHIRVRSRDAAGNLAVSDDRSFTTTALTTPSGTTERIGSGGGACGGGAAAMILAACAWLGFRRPAGGPRRRQAPIAHRDDDQGAVVISQPPWRASDQRPGLGN